VRVLDAESVAASLCATHPVSVENGLQPETAGGLPAVPGFYAWWVDRSSIVSLPHHPHPSAPDLDLLYVGISPKRASSSGTVRSRVIDQHVRGNISSSTLRFALAAFLMGELKLNPRATRKKVTLDRDGNARLREWQFAHLALTWCARDQPWEVEDAVIALMQPPLNCAANESHPFHPHVTSARAALRTAARTSSASRS